MAYLVSLIFPGVFGEITEWRNANFNIAHRPQRCSVLVGPDLRAGRFMACTVTLLGRLGDPPLPHSLARMRLLNTHEMPFRNRLRHPDSSSEALASSA